MSTGLETAGRVHWHTSMSLDGFIAGPGDAMDWIFEYADAGEGADEVIAKTGALLVGRRSYDVGRSSQRPETQEAYGGAWSGSQLVLTHRPPRDEQDATITFLSGDIRSAVATALRAANGKNVGIIGANVARQCIDAGLVDEIIIHVVPVLLGDGVRLFERQGAPLVALERTSVTTSGQVTLLCFRVVK